MAKTSFFVKVKKIGEVQQVTDKFSKIEIIGEELYNDEKDNLLMVQGINKMAFALKDLFVGQVVQFKVEIQGREWSKDGVNMFFQNLIVTSFEAVKGKHKVDKPEEPSGNISAKDINTDQHFPDDNGIEKMKENPLISDLTNDDDGDLPF